MPYDPIPTIEVETVNTTLQGWQSQSGTLGLDGGGWITWWVNLDAVTSQYSHRVQIYAADGSQVGTELVVLGSNSSPFDIVQLSDGRLLITNIDAGSGGSVRGRFLEPDGNGLSAPFVLQSLSATTNNSFTQAIAQEDGGFWMVGRAAEQVTLRSFDSDAALLTITTLSSIVGPSPSQPDFPRDAQIVALASGGAAVAWAVVAGNTSTGSIRGLQMRIVDVDGIPGDTVHDIDLPNNIGNPRGLTMTALDGGGFVVGWYMASGAFGNSAYGQVFDATGAAIGPILQFNETANVLAQFPSLAAMPDGGFVAVWEENQTPVPTIFVQRYAADGTAIGPNSQIAAPPGYDINSDLPARHDAPSITVLEDGGFVVSWTLAAFPGGVADFDILQRRFDPQTFGTSENEVLQGSSGNDWISGLGGRDTIEGGAGNDTLFGDLGNDRIFGGTGDDLIFGGIGRDMLYGGSGANTLHGDEGNDLIFGGSDADLVYGGAGADLINGNDGNDTLYGGDGADTVHGDSGNDRLFGGIGSDMIYGGAGDDRINGNTGSDTLYGGEGNDTLIGSAGKNQLWGGSGADVFLFQTLSHNRIAGNRDTIMDFETGTDRIDIKALHPALDFIGVAAFGKVAGEVRFSNGLLEIDTTGNGRANWAIEVQGLVTLDPGDLIM